MTSKEILLEQMSACYDETNWFVTVKDSLKGLSKEQSEMKEVNSNHSPREIVNHLIFWNERYLMRFKGITPPKMEGENTYTFTNEGANLKDADWESAVKKLDEVFSGLKDALKNADEEKLESSAFGDEASWYLVFAHINIHNAYHIGQLVSLRKQQGSWDSEAGVK